MRVKVRNIAICAIIAIAILAAGFMIMPFSAKAEPGQENWTDGHIYEADYAYGGGTGVDGDPYIIYTAEHLAQLACNQNDTEHISTTEGSQSHYEQSYSRRKYFKLGEDIDLSGKNWIPIGNRVGVNRNNTFVGGFDFAGHRITGISHSGYDGQYYGLFGVFAAGWIKNADIAYGNVTVNMLCGEGSIYDNALDFSAGTFGGVAGTCIGGGTIGASSGDSSIRVAYEGNMRYNTPSGARRAYVGGLVGYAMGGVIGHDGAAGNTDIIVEIGKNGSFYADYEGSGLLYMGGMIGSDATSMVLGKSNNDNDSDVNIRFVNNSTQEVGFGGTYATNDSRIGGLVANSLGIIGSNGTGDGDVNIGAVNYGNIKYTTNRDASYSAGLIGSLEGLLGTKGTGDVKVYFENHGTLYSEIVNNNDAEIRTGGLVGALYGTVGIANASSEGDVVLMFENKDNGKFKKTGQWNYNSGVLCGYKAEGSLVGTQGTGTLQYVTAAKIDSLVYHVFESVTEEHFPAVLFHRGRGNASAGKVGSLNGGETVEQNKTFGYFVTDIAAAEFDKYNEWETSVDITDKLTATQHTSWSLGGATADGVIMELLVDDGYAFRGWTDGTTALKTKDGIPYAVYNGADALPAADILDISTVEVDFTSKVYTGSPLSPTADGYTVVALGADGSELNMVNPATYKIKAVKLYEGSDYIGQRTFDDEQDFVITKAANSSVAAASVLSFDADNETYTLSSIYELATDNAFGTKLPNSGSITQYKGESLYVRYRETDTHEASAATEITVAAYTLTLTETEGVTFVTVDNRTAFLYGASYEFGITVNAGYKGTPVVKLNGNTVEDDDGIYLIVIEENSVVSVEGISQIVYHDVTVSADSGLTVTPVTEGQTTVADGESFSFTVTKSAGFEGEFTVKVNGSEIADTDGVYTVNNVTEAIEIKAEKTASQGGDNTGDNNGGNNGNSSGDNNNNNSDNQSGNKKKKCGSEASGACAAAAAILSVTAAAMILHRNRKTCVK